MELNGKNVLVLGGSSGIGMAVARAANAQGAQVTIVSSNPDRVSAALLDLPDGCAGESMNLADGDSIRAFFDRREAIDHLVYTAGEAIALGMLEDCDVADARRFWEIRYWGAFQAAKAAHRHIRPGGSILFTSGLASRRPRAGWATPSSICGAVEGLTRALAVELAPIRVNAVAPGVVRSPLWRNIEEDAREAFYRETAAHLPVQHVASPDEVAAGYLYLMQQTFVTGQTLFIEGGGLLA
jgi:NAD(P)-dependent dehydrogenase (short-subunit alcohol dehydrogenase family)